MKTILFADDNKHIREHCRSVLEDEGYRVVVARDGFDALRVSAEACPDVAVLDISMPRMGGLAALQRLNAVSPEVPVILFTAYDEDCVSDPRGGLAAACVEKSEDLTELKRTIRRLLELKARDKGWPALRLGLPPESCAAKCQESTVSEDSLA
jgi:CheY-like chemotaxis protein